MQEEPTTSAFVGYRLDDGNHVEMHLVDVPIYPQGGIMTGATEDGEWELTGHMDKKGRFSFVLTCGEQELFFWGKQTDKSQLKGAWGREQYEQDDIFTLRLVKEE